METSHVDDDFTHRNMQYINSASNHAMMTSRGVETTSPMTSQRHILQTSERDALNREMAFNIKIGKDVLEKSELEKTLSRRKESIIQKELLGKQAMNRSSFELKMEERANLIKCEEEEKLNADSVQNEADDVPEFVKIYKRLKHNKPNLPTG